MQTRSAWSRRTNKFLESSELSCDFPRMYNLFCQNPSLVPKGMSCSINKLMPAHENTADQSQYQ